MLGIYRIILCLFKKAKDGFWIYNLIKWTRTKLPYHIPFLIAPKYKAFNFKTCLTIQLLTKSLAGSKTLPSKFGLHKVPTRWTSSPRIIRKKRPVKLIKYIKLEHPQIKRRARQPSTAKKDSFAIWSTSMTLRTLNATSKFTSEDRDWARIWHITNMCIIQTSLSISGTRSASYIRETKNGETKSVPKLPPSKKEWEKRRSSWSTTSKRCSYPKSPPLALTTLLQVLTRSSWNLMDIVIQCRLPR